MEMYNKYSLTLPWLAWYAMALYSTLFVLYRLIACRLFLFVFKALVHTHISIPAYDFIVRAGGSKVPQTFSTSLRNFD